jgi:hypothetical protein
MGRFRATGELLSFACPKKVTKVNDTPYRSFPVLLSFMGGNR